MGDGWQALQKSKNSQQQILSYFIVCMKFSTIKKYNKEKWTVVPSYEICSSYQNHGQQHRMPPCWVGSCEVRDLSHPIYIAESTDLKVTRIPSTYYQRSNYRVCIRKGTRATAGQREWHLLLYRFRVFLYFPCRHFNRLHPSLNSSSFSVLVHCM